MRGRRQGRGQGERRRKGDRGAEREQSKGGPHIRARGLLIRRQSILYIFLLGVGGVLIHLSDLRNMPLVTEGVAFIAIGAVGLIMSWTTQEIGQGIKGAVSEDGCRTRERLDVIADAFESVSASVEKVGASVEKVGASVEKVGASVERDGGLTRERLDVMTEEIKNVGASVEKVGASVEKVGASIDAMGKDNKDFFREMLKTQTAILERQTAILEKVS